MRKANVLMVCMGNICRSPTAEAVLKKMVADRGHGRRMRGAYRL